MSMRIGYGYDSHEFQAGVPLVIGGVKLEHTHGLAGHSDGDVLLHAITDALLGAVAAGDIGTFSHPAIRNGRAPTRLPFWKRRCGRSNWRVFAWSTSIRP
jgi:2-C-methyl-D-erythritol 2,4-cyclodiphosphate synthase